MFDQYLKDHKKIYPNWYSLTEEEQSIVSKIASQIALTCEYIATIYVKFSHDNARKTVEYLKKWHGYEVEV